MICVLWGGIAIDRDRDDRDRGGVRGKNTDRGRRGHRCFCVGL